MSIKGIPEELTKTNSLTPIAFAKLSKPIAFKGQSNKQDESSSPPIPSFRYINFENEYSNRYKDKQKTFTDFIEEVISNESSVNFAKIETLRNKEVKKFILGENIGNSRISSITDYGEFYELSNLSYVKIENNSESMADQFLFSVPLSPSYFNSNNSRLFTSIITELTFTLNNREDISFNPSDTEGDSYLQKIIDSGRLIELYTGYLEQCPDQNITMYDKHINKFVGVIDKISVNEVYNIITFSGRDLTGPLMDIKSAVSFSKDLVSIQDVVKRKLLKGTGYVLLEHLYPHNIGLKNSVSERASKNSFPALRGGGSYNVYNEGYKAYAAAEYSSGDAKYPEYINAVKSFYMGYANETLSFWDVLQAAASLTGHMVYLLPGTNIIYFGVPEARQAKYDLYLPDRDPATSRILNNKIVEVDPKTGKNVFNDTACNVSQFRYSMPSITDSKTILITTTVDQKGNRMSIAVAPKEIIKGFNNQPPKKPQEIADALKLRITSLAQEGISNENQSELQIYTVNKISYNLLLASSASTFGSTFELFMFSSMLAYKRLLLESVKANASIVGNGNLGQAMKTKVKNANILNRIFTDVNMAMFNNEESSTPTVDSLNFAISEATHIFSSEKGFVTDLILEKFFNVQNMYETNPPDSEIIAIPIRGISNETMNKHHSDFAKYIQTGRTR